VLRAAALAVVAVAVVSVGGPFARQDGGGGVDVLRVEGAIDPPVAGAIAGLIADAEARDAELVVLELDSPGGLSLDLPALLSALRSPVPVAVLVGPRLSGAEATGAAAYLAAAASVVAIAPDATIGPADPPDLTAPDGVGPPPDEARPIARVRVTGAEAVALGVADLTVNGLGSLLDALDGRSVPSVDGETVLETSTATVRFHGLGLFRRALHASTSPAFVYLVLVLALALLLFEWFQPGFGVAGVAGLLLVPLATYGLVMLPARWWAVGLLLLGPLLLAIDLAIGGLGAPSVLGAGALVAGSLTLYGGDASLALSPWLVGTTSLVTIIFFVIVMTIVLRAQAGPPAEDLFALVGREGVVRSVLDPEGHVYVDGALWRARSTATGRMATGTRVVVEGTDEGVLLVGVEDS